MKYFYTLVLAVLCFLTNAQTGVAVNADGSTADPKAMLDVKATGQGAFMPRMTWANRPTGLTATHAGLMIYSTDGDGTNGVGFYFWDGTAWQNLKFAAYPVGDNLGNHTATQNVRLNGNSLSNDGGTEGVTVDNAGAVSTSSTLVVGSTATINGNDVRSNPANQNLMSLSGNGNIRMRLDVDNTGSNDFAVQNGSGSNIFTVTEGGNFSSTGSGTIDGDLTITGSSARTLQTNDAFNFRGSSGIDINIDSDNNNVSTELRFMRNGGTTVADVMFGVPEDQNPLAYPFGTGTGQTGGFRMRELAANGTNFVGFRAPDILASDLMFTLPATNGSSNQVLTTNGTGTLSWNTVNTLATPTNGLQAIGANIGLGGTLSQTTTVSNGNFDLTYDLTGTGDYGINDGGVQVFRVFDNGRAMFGRDASGDAPIAQLDVLGASAANATFTGMRIRNDNNWSSGNLFSAALELVNSTNDVSTNGTQFRSEIINSTGLSNLYIGVKDNSVPGYTERMRVYGIDGSIRVTGPIFSTNSAPSGTASPISSGDLGLYSLTNGAWIRFVSNQAPIRFFQDANTSTGGTNVRVSIETDGSLEAREGFKTQRRYRHYKRSRGNGQSGTDNLGNWDMCYLTNVSYRNNQNVSDEDQDYQCTLWITQNASSDYANVTLNEGVDQDVQLDFNYATRPYWRLYTENFEDGANATCTVTCVNFDF